MSGMRGACWSAEEHNYLVESWTEGCSAAEIGRELGRSRNAVIGRLHRKLGVGVERKIAPRPLNKIVPGKVANARLVAGPRVQKIKAPKLTPDARPDGFVGKRIDDLKTGECHYIAGESHDAVYCGAPSALESRYCAAHHRLCHQAGTAWRGGKRVGGLASFAKYRDMGPHYVAGWGE